MSKSNLQSLCAPVMKMIIYVKVSIFLKMCILVLHIKAIKIPSSICFLFFFNLQ